MIEITAMMAVRRSRRQASVPEKGWEKSANKSAEILGCDVGMSLEQEEEEEKAVVAGCFYLIDFHYQIPKCIKSLGIILLEFY